jgi:hypothetical protein
MHKKRSFTMKTQKSTALVGIFTVLAVLGLIGCGDKGDPSSPATHIHQWGDWTVTRAATCTTEGEKTRVCTLDGTTETQKIPIDLVNGHDYRYVAGSGTAPTCEVDGYGDELCFHNPNHKREGVVIAKLGHDWAWVVTSPATCTTAGAETGTCSHDSTHTTKRTIPIDPEAHDYGNWIQTAAPTFITPGVETETCKNDPSHTNGTRTFGDSLPITTTAEWNTALSQLNGKTGEYTLNISGDIGVAGDHPISYSFGQTPTGSSLRITLYGIGKLYLTSQGRLITIGVNQTLIIDSETLTLEGLKDGQNGATQDNTATVVFVYNGTLELKNGIISGNTIIDGFDGSGFNYFGGGVRLYDTNSTFTMSGGEISGNTCANGGGVANGGTFEMSGGIISGNTGSGVSMNSPSASFTMKGGVISGNTAEWGGGVYAGSNSTFRITEGTIYGADEDEGIRNTGTNGAALYGQANYGTFIGEAWDNKGTLYTTNDTIKVVGGVLQ